LPAPLPACHSRCRQQVVIASTSAQIVGKRISGDGIVSSPANDVFESAGGLQIQAEIRIHHLICRKTQVDRNCGGVGEREIKRVDTAANFVERDKSQCIVRVKPINVVPGPSDQ